MARPQCEPPLPKDIPLTNLLLEISGHSKTTNRQFTDNYKISGVNKSARERIGRQNLSQKVRSRKGSLRVIFSPRNYRGNAHSKSANFEGRHSGGHLLGRPLLFTSVQDNCKTMNKLLRNTSQTSSVSYWVPFVSLTNPKLSSIQLY